MSIIRTIARVVSVLFWVVIIVASLFFFTSPFIWKQEKVLNVLAWGDMIDSHVIAQFRKKTGIQVQVHAYSSHKELLVTAEATQCKGYDIIIATDMAIQTLRQKKLIKPLDRRRITGLQERINPVLMGHYYDPYNLYSLPYNWEIFVLGYDRTFFTHGIEHPHWGLLFEPKGYRVAMLNDPFEAVNIATLYMLPATQYPRDRLLSRTEIASVKDILKGQKKWVEAYAEFRADYFLLTGNCPLVVSSLSPILRGMSDSDTIDFVIPEEGTFVTIENLAISATTTKDTYVYDFMEYLFTDEIIKHNFEALLSLPSINNAIEVINPSDSVRKLLDLNREEFSTFYFYKSHMPEAQLNDLWVSVKASLSV